MASLFRPNFGLNFPTIGNIRIDEIGTINGDGTALAVGGALSLTGALTPATSDGAALGSAALMYSDLFLASGGVINFDNGDIAITHSANLLTLSSGSLRSDLSGVIADSATTTKTGTLDASGATVTLPTRSAFIDLEEAFKGADGAVLALSETAGDFFRNVGTNQWLIDGEATVNETEASVGLFSVVLPENYVSGGTISIVISALVVLAGDAANDPTSTIDCTLLKVTKATGAVGADLVTTAAQTLATAGADYTFVVTPTGLVAGDKLTGAVTTSVVETAGGTGAANSRITRFGATIQVNK